MFSLFTSHSFAAKKHKIYKKLPCYFNGVKVGPSAQKDSGVRGGRCCVGCSAYKEKRGTSMEVRRGTPVVAITDMKVIKIEDSSAEQRSTSYLKDKYGEWILYDPEFNKNTYFLWLLPILLFIVGGAIILKLFIIKKF